MGTKYYRVLTLALLCLPVSAYRSGNDIIIRQHFNRKPTLLDRKFIFLLDELKSSQQNTNSSLAALSKVAPRVQKQYKVTKLEAEKIKPQNIHDDDNWDTWKEELDVHAKLR
jgi:hypothetical protein